MNEKVKKLSVLGMFAALAYVFVLVGRIPISSVEFLKYDPKDIVVAICGFIMGPVSALIVTVITSFLEMVTISTTGFIGLVMNIISTASFACTAAFIYKKKKTLLGAVIGLIAGALSMTVLMLLWNYLITPIYMGYPREAVADMLAPVFLPFNLIKSGLNASFTMLLYKPVVTAMRKAHIISDTPVREKEISASDGEIKESDKIDAENEVANAENRPHHFKINVWTVVISLFIIAICVLWVLAIKKII